MTNRPYRDAATTVHELLSHRIARLGEWANAPILDGHPDSVARIGIQCGYDERARIGSRAALSAWKLSSSHSGRCTFRLTDSFGSSREVILGVAPICLHHALQQQLGLRLQIEKTPVDVLVIDCVGPP